ncbi:DUF3095 domain-containing protein [Leptospira idonii]|uniref:DUF3095 domain-containing protein n=1 Tax=Leptospira idonii TaxID=1193500 RepID=A0A4R9LY49_9LEPT|nr:DUF3095 domain-containing protein [Leptospira idonii]TGN19233.1 DUF3095 domain-containing protein [Leptospira idonii]
MDDFYQTLEASPDFRSVFDQNGFLPVPDDWFVLITDIVGSTKAIESGRYKDVNTAGGLTAIAVANVYGHMDFPFVFGGDGVSFLLPITYLFPIRSAIADTIGKVRAGFDLEMKAGIVPVQELYKHGAKLYLSKFEASTHYNQCSIYGDGLSLAESWIKSEEDESFLVRETEKITDADFTGFTCRWKDIPSEKGEVISLIIRPESTDYETSAKLISRVLNFIRTEFGEEEDYHPVATKQLFLDNGPNLKKEALAHSGGRKGIGYLFRLMKIWFERVAVDCFIRFKIPFRSFHYRLDRLKEYQVLSADFRKYDGTLKMVISGTKENRLALREYLDDLSHQEKILYGMHISNRSLMTCILKVGSSQEVHFVDGADGGFALAAKELKQKMKQKI